MNLLTLRVTEGSPYPGQLLVPAVARDTTQQGDWRRAVIHLIGVILAGSQLLTPVSAEQPYTTYDFETADFRIEMAVQFLPPYQGQRLVFYSSALPNKELCYSGNGQPGACLERFVGSVALVTYRLKPTGRDVRPAASFREVVTVVAQAPGLPGRDKYQREQALVDGVGSDVQAFGYDESKVEERALPAVRTQWRSAWRTYRQEVFVNDDHQPFAVIEWKHTLSRIEVVRVAGRQNLNKQARFGRKRLAASLGARGKSATNRLLARAAQ